MTKFLTIETSSFIKRKLGQVPMQRHAFPYIIVALALSLVTLGFIVLSSHTYHKEIALTTEKELKATIEAGFAKLTIAKCKSSFLFESNVSSEENYDIDKCIDYDVRDQVGYLNLCTTEDRNGKNKSFHFSDFDAGTWNTYFTGGIPISFDIELGLGKGDFDFTGLAVKDLSLSAGASSVSLRFDKPNTSEIEDLTIEAGLSKFEAKNLLNANFNHMTFEGGVGSYRLDFGGSIEKEVDVSIEVGLGSLTITIPDNIGAKVIYQKNIISHFDIDNDFSEQTEDNYLSTNYYSTAGKINFRIDAGLGSVKIRRR